MMRECAETSAPWPLLGRMRRSQRCGWLRRISSMLASSFAAWPSLLTTLRLEAEEEEEDDDEEELPALRFRPPAFPVLRRLPRELMT